MDITTLKESIRTIPNYPREGILFYDITTLLNDGVIFNQLIDELRARYAGCDLDFIAGIESRGFIFGAALAKALNIGFVPIRKKGKLPSKIIQESYELEYGQDCIEIHIDAFKNIQNAKVVLIDDLIATGGSANAALNLIKRIGGECVEACFILNLVELGGLEKMQRLCRAHTILDI